MQMRTTIGILLITGRLACSSTSPQPETPDPPPVPSAAPLAASIGALPDTSTVASNPTSAPTEVAVVDNAFAPTERVAADGLRVTDLTLGSGREVFAGATVLVHYEGRLENGAVFDSSIARGAPLEVKIGKGQLIKGWDEGIVGMRVGGRRKLVIPSALGYGDRGMPPKIPPNATLVFEVQLLGVR